MIRLLCTALTFFAFGAAVSADNWPAWRGPDGQGHTAEKNLPTKWGPAENVKWKVPLPDDGNSTPVVWGERVFLTQAIGKAANSKRMLWCLDRADGKKLWEKEVAYEPKETTHATNPYCSASPVTDGEVVVVSFGSAGMYCFDFAGKELWKKDLGKMEHIWGNAASPVLYGDLAILWAGPGERQFLIAVDKKTGDKVWQHDEPGGKFGKDNSEWLGSWSTPLIAKVGDHDELILGVPNRLKGFDPKTGKELWHCDGLGKLVYTSALYGDGIVVAMSGFHGPALAVKLGGTGDITRDRLWHQTAKNPQRIGSGVIVGEYIYILEDSGEAHCFELKTGKEVWQQPKRLGATKNWGSMVATGDGRLYVMGWDGTTHILTASPKFEELAANALKENTNSSIAVSNGELFIRTNKHLWCIAERKRD